MTKEELIEFLKENISISIERDHGYYSYPELEVAIYLRSEKITESRCTIYDGDS